MILYQREGCHLCEEALVLLHSCGQGGVELCDIDESPELGVQYGLRIPVLRDTAGRELDWPFDQASLLSWLQNP